MSSIQKNIVATTSTGHSDLVAIPAGYYFANRKEILNDYYTPVLYPFDDGRIKKAVEQLVMQLPFDDKAILDISPDGKRVYLVSKPDNGTDITRSGMYRNAADAVAPETLLLFQRNHFPELADGEVDYGFIKFFT